MANQNPNKKYLSAFCFVVSIIIAGFIFFVCGTAALEGRDLPPNTIVAGSIALLAAAISARSVEER